MNTPAVFYFPFTAWRRLPRGTWAWGLLLALLVAPLLGVLHMAVHPQAVPGMAGAQSVQATRGVSATKTSAAINDSRSLSDPSALAGTEQVRPTAFGWLDRLFGHQAGGTDCRLFDQLCQGHALPSVPVVLAALLPPAALFVFFLLGRIVQRDALFHARAPPALR